MIKKQIQKQFINNHYDGLESRKYEEQWILDKIITEEFNNDGKLVVKSEEKILSDKQLVSQGLTKITTKYDYDNHGSIIKKDWSSPMRFSLNQYNNKYDCSGNLIGYDNKYKCWDSYIKSNDNLEYTSFTTCEIELKYHEVKQLISSRKTKKINNGITFNEKTESFYYDKSNELINKHVERINKSPEGDVNSHRIEKYSFYFDDKGEKIEQMDSFNIGSDGGLNFYSKTIKSHNGLYFLDKNNDTKQKYLYFYDEYGLKIKEEHYPSYVHKFLYF